MEAGEAGTRQSGYHSARKPDLYIHPQQQPSSQPGDPQHREAPAMATATLISPSVPYHGYPTPYAPTPAPAPSYQNQQGAGGAGTGGMISPVEPRRGSNESDSSHRQSLPSISEVISAAKPSPYQPPAPPPSAPTTMAGSSFPSPYTSTPGEKNPSPRQLQPPPSTFPTRQDPIPAYPDVSRPPSFSDRSAPPHPTGYPAPHPSPPIQGDKPPYSGDRLVDHHMNGAYPPPSGSQPPAPYPQHNQLPPGQLPLTPFPASPRHVGPLPPTPYEAPRPPVADEAEFPHARPRYDATLSRHFEQWGYQENLGRIASSTRTIYNFAEAWSRIAQEQLGSRPVPDRLPSEREINDMLSNTEFIRRSLENVRDLVQQNNLAERGKKGLYHDEDVAMYEDGMKPTYAISEVKKRRGRAAPPGRCHSCNRIDTPEWRRGPDGARTLCNACGLHYAKLERKRQLEARSLRPKPPETR